MTRQVLPWVVRVKRGGWPAIWLPLFVLWPIILVVFGLLLPLCLLLPGRARAALAALAASYRVLCATHGAEFELGDPSQGSWTFSLY
jgi:hypothetical protein